VRLRKAQKWLTQGQKLHCVHPQQKWGKPQIDLAENLSALLAVGPHLRMALRYKCGKDNNEYQNGPYSKSQRSNERLWHQATPFLVAFAASKDPKFELREQQRPNCPPSKSSGQKSEPVSHQLWSKDWPRSRMATVSP